MQRPTDIGSSSTDGTDGTETAPRLAAQLGRALRSLAAALWLGGLLTVGAVVAPAIFHEIPAPGNADAMLAVFRRFDRVALAAVVVVALGEVLQRDRSVTRRDVWRFILFAAAGALSVARALWFSPRIEALHLGGAVRGVGALGAQLDRFHHAAERCAQAEVVAVAGYLVLLALAVRSPGKDPPDAHIRG